MQRIGLISDTHGLVRPEAIAFLRGCDRIVHGGDICGPEVLKALGRIAPVVAVRGNNDHGAWAEAIPTADVVEIERVLLYAIHDLGDLDIDPVAAGIAVVMSGHSHRPLVEKRDGVLYVNPGSAGPRRFRLPISIGELLVSGDDVEARIVTLA